MTPFRRALEDREPDVDYQEESYRELFPKIGRDFVYVEDLIDVLSQLQVLGFQLDLSAIRTRRAATTRAHEYANGLANYKDLIEWNDE